MYCLIHLLKGGMTVVFESAIQGCFWVFEESGSYMKGSVANIISCPELNSHDTVHIFDAKAGATREPVETPAILIVTSSTNDVSYKQTARRARIHPICVYPSTTTEEFYHYVSVFKINVEEAQQIAELCGTGKI
jgi:hypothetical protein